MVGREHGMTNVDAGSQVTTVVIPFYNKHFSDCELNDVSELLVLVHVGGGAVPYYRYSCVKVSVPVGKGKVVSEVIPVLVVPYTAYNAVGPLLIGTNYSELISQDFKIPINSMCQALQTVVKSM